MFFLLYVFDGYLCLRPGTEKKKNNIPTFINIIKYKKHRFKKILLLMPNLSLIIISKLKSKIDLF